MNIGLFDMDGSLADYEGQLQRDLHKILNEEDQDVLANTNLWELDELPHFKAMIALIKNQEGWWRKLPLIENGMKIFNMAEDIGFDCHILTKGPKKIPNAWREKVEWCQQRLGNDIDIHITSDKGLVYGKFLYDDYVEYVEKWLKYRPRGLVIMPVNDQNKDFKHPQVIKWDGTNFEEVKSALVACYERQVKSS